MFKYIKTAEMTAKNQTNGGILYLLPNYLIRVVYLFPLIMLWRVLMISGVDTGMSLSQMLTYTFLSNLFGDLLNIQTSLTHWIMDTKLVGMYQRPMTVFGFVAAESIGAAIPGLLLFSLPMLCLSPLFGVSMTPASLWSLPSLLLCMSLGFAVEFIFAAMLVRMVNASWLVHSIRSAITYLFSGAAIPFAVLPFGLSEIMKYQPLGSLGGAPLAIYTGLAEPVSTILIQIAWNIVLWPFAIFVFNQSRERMISYGI